MTNDTLRPHDLQFCLKRLHPSVRAMLQKYGAQVCVSGGFIRSCVANEDINDIDLFGPTEETVKAWAAELALSDKGSHKIYETANALSVKGFGSMVQFIHRWTFSHPTYVVPSFDFTIAQAALWFEDGEWRSYLHPDFYADLAAKRLVYTSPVRNEDAGGSMLRVLKFYQRGYRIPLESLAAVIARMSAATGVDTTLDTLIYAEGKTVEEAYAKIYTAQLHEVDPQVDPTHEAHLPALTPPTPDLDF